MKAENSNERKPGPGGARPGGGRPKGRKDTTKRKAKKSKKAKTRKPVPPLREAGPVKPEETPYPRYRRAPEVELTPYPEVGDEVKKYGPRDTDFEKKLASHLRKPKQEKPKPSTPALQEQSEFEIKIITDFLKLPFALWASRINFPAIRLTDQEAKEWAEPTKVLLDHYMPRIPKMAYAWIAWSITTTSIMNTRFEAISFEKRKRSESQTEAKAGPVKAPTQGAPIYKPAKI